MRSFDIPNASQFWRLHTDVTQRLADVFGDVDPPSTEQVGQKPLLVGFRHLHEVISVQDGRQQIGRAKLLSKEGLGGIGGYSLSIDLNDLRSWCTSAADRVAVFQGRRHLKPSFTRANQGVSPPARCISQFASSREQVVDRHLDGALATAVRPSHAVESIQL